MNNKFISAALTAGLLVSGCSSPESLPEQAPSSSPETFSEDSGMEILFTAEEISRKQEVADHWVAQAELLAENVEDELTNEIVSMLKDSGLAAPVMKESGELAVQYIEVSQVGAPFLAPLSNEDLKLLPEGMLDNAAAVYNIDMNTIFFHEDKFSDTFGAIVLLHEGKHAIDYLYEAYDWQDPQIFSYFEADTHDYQNFLMSKIGGEDYDNLLNSYLVEVNKVMEIRQDGLSVPERTEYMEELDDIFGPASSDTERNTRQTHMWLAAIFTRLDQSLSPDEAMYYKVFFLMDRYQQDGIIGK